MTMLKWTAFVGLMFSVFLLAACTLPEYVELYNNSSSDISVRFGAGRDARQFELRSKEVARIGPVAFGRGEVVIVRGSTPHTYRPKYSGSRYWTYVGFGPFKSMRVRLQYEENGSVLVLPRDAEFPISPSVEQPPDYPLREAMPSVFQ